MKKQFYILFLLAFLGCFSAFAQDETDGAGSSEVPKGHVLSVFSQDGAPFWLVLNGVKQSDKAGARVKVVGLKLGYYRARIIFQDESKSAIDTRIQLEGVDPGFNHVVYVIRPSKLKKDKGMLVLAADYFESIAKPKAKAAEVAKSTQDDEFPTYGYTTTKPEPMDEMGMEVLRKTMDFTTDIIKMGVEMDQTNPAIGIPTPPPNTTKKPVKKPKPVQVEDTNEDAEPQAAPKKRSSNSCIVPMSQSKFNEALGLIKQESFSSDMVAAAKDLADAECLSCAQIVTIMSNFSHESEKAEFAKYAYNKCTDKKDFVRLINARLTFSGSKAEIRQFVQDNQ
jgi:hypothetical protein